MRESPSKVEQGTAVEPRAKSAEERILQAGKRLFAAKGFDQTTTAAIAREAGSSESQLIKYFENKDGLLRAIFEDGWQRLSFVYNAAAIAESPEEKLRVIFELIARALQEDRELRNLMLFEGRRVRSQSSEILLTTGYYRLISEVETLVAPLLKTSGLQRELSPRAVASALIGMLESMLRDQAIAERRDGKSQPKGEEIRAMFRLMIGCFKK